MRLVNLEIKEKLKQLPHLSGKPGQIKRVDLRHVHVGRKLPEDGEEAVEREQEAGVEDQVPEKGHVTIKPKGHHDLGVLVENMGGCGL